jgi:hypothetical protein
MRDPSFQRTQVAACRQRRRLVSRSDALISCMAHPTIGTTYKRRTRQKKKKRERTRHGQASWSVFDFDDRSTPGSPACAGCTYCVQLALARFDHRGAPGLDPYLRRPIRSDACADGTEHTTRDRHKCACMHACMQRVQSQNTYVQRVDGMESIRRVRAFLHACMQLELDSS